MIFLHAFVPYKDGGEHPLASPGDECWGAGAPNLPRSVPRDPCPVPSRPVQPHGPSSLTGRKHSVCLIKASYICIPPRTVLIPNWLLEGSCCSCERPSILQAAEQLPQPCWGALLFPHQRCQVPPLLLTETCMHMHTHKQLILVSIYSPVSAA